MISAGAGHDLPTTLRTQAVNNTPNLEESAATLLLRSPRLSVSLVLDLLDISDAKFREMVKQNATLSALLELRRRGELIIEEPELRACRGCDEWFIPYAGARYCSDECLKMAFIESGKRPTHPRIPRITPATAIS